MGHSLEWRNREIILGKTNGLAAPNYSRDISYDS
jgi:hypothetical protein